MTQVSEDAGSRRSGWSVGWRVSLTIALVLGVSISLRLRSWPDMPGFPAVFLWMLAVWAPWTPATALVVALSRRFPLVSRWSVTVFVHAAASVTLALVHVAYFVALSSRVSPFLGVPLTKYGAFAFFFLFWFQLDLLLYWALLALVTVRSSEAELRRRERRTRELELQVVESQLQALKLQIQPHFLFNTLNTVVAMQRVGDVEKATRMTVALSELLRLLLASGDAHEVTLSRELEILERYLEIEQFRFEDRLVVDQCVDEGVARALVPTLFLQPLVENAIRHGVASLTGRREVRVSVRRSGDRLAIEVVNDAGHRPGAAEGLGIGLQNLRRRLQELYASDHELSLEIEDGRSLVRVELPLQLTPGGAG